MPGKLTAALQWAARGFRVFPVRENEKFPPIEADWTATATTDPATIRRWWTDPLLGIEREYNIGVETTGLVVADLDMRGGKNGLATYMGLGLGFDSLMVRTPSGGFHVYYSGPADLASDQDLLAKGSGLDIRAWHGYVLAPGSTVNGGHGYTVELDLPVRMAPPSLLQFLKPHRILEARSSWQGEDTEAAMIFARDYLALAPVAVEGQGGDSTTYQVACKVRDFGVTPETAHRLMLTWNARCSPPWDEHELLAKVQNAYDYARGEAGSLAPSVLFEGVQLIEPEREGVPTLEWEAQERGPIPPRPWIMRGLLLQRSVSALVGAGGAGKSTLILAIAAHLAFGRDFLGYKTEKPLRSIIFTAEDDADENARRLHALCALYGFDLAELQKRMLLVYGEKDRFQVTTGSRPPVPRLSHIEALIKVAKPADIGLIAFDPLIEFHTAREDDNVEMRIVLEGFREIARQAGVAVLISHHTSKPGTRNDDRAGDVYAARGASSIIALVRIALTLFGASDRDCMEYGIHEHERRRYMRLDDGKANYSLGSAMPRWLYKETYRLYNGDDVGCLVPTERLQTALQERAANIGRILVAEMAVRATASLTITEAAEIVQGVDGIYARMTTAQVKQRIEAYLRAGLEIAGNKLIAQKSRVVIE